MEQLVILILAGIAGLIKVALKARSETDSTPPPSPRTENDAERIRRFREAMGLPPSANLPPPVKPRPPAPAQPLPQIPAPNRFPGLPQAGRLRRVQPTTPPLTQRTAPARPLATQAPAPMPTRSSTPALTPVEATLFPEAPPPAYSPAITRTGGPTGPSRSQLLVARLRDPASIREAIVLREILGPPKALQRVAQMSHLF